jgi:predicted amidohydrolase YtcJ
MDAEDTIAEAVVIMDGRIFYVGHNIEAKQVIGRATQIIDLRGCAVLPGFIDAHNHLAISAIDSVAVDCSPEKTQSIEDILMKIVSFAKMNPHTEWIRGVNYDDARLTEKRHPTRWDIDRVFNDRPVLLVHRGYHIAVINSAGMRTLGITDETKPPIGGEYGRDSKTDQLNGVLYENAWFDLWGKKNSPLDVDSKTFIKGVHTVCSRYVRAGITSVNDAWVVPSNFKGFQAAFRLGRLPIRVNVHIFNSYLNQLEELGILKGFGNDYLKIIAVKLLLDGSVSGLTAALYEPYIGTEDRGILLMKKNDLEELVERIHKLGFQVSIHANGDRAIDMVLDVFEHVLERNPQKDHRHRIEHCSLLNPQRIQRIKALGLVPVIFAAYPFYHGDKIYPAFGTERVKWLMACRSLLDAGVKIAGHSDFPASPFNPLLAIHSLVNRKTERGIPFSPNQAITVHEALRMYTIDAAFASFDESIKGSIEQGKYADLTILQDNPLTVENEKLKEIRVVMTIVNGHIIYKNKKLIT